MKTISQATSFFLALSFFGHAQALDSDIHMKTLQPSNCSTPLKPSQLNAKHNMPTKHTQQTQSNAGCTKFQTLGEFIASMNFVGYRFEQNSALILDRKNKIISSGYFISLFDDCSQKTLFRFFSKNSILTMDYNPNRVNIMFDENNLILRVSLG